MFTIAVIGCGVIGLSTALAIQKELKSKAKVIIFADKLSPHTTSDVAAGLWCPYLFGNTPEKKIVKWSKSTYDYILNLWKQGEAKDAGITLQLVITLSEEKVFEVPSYVELALGHSVLPTDQVKKYEEKFGKEYSGGYTTVTFAWEASKFLPYLQEKFLRNGGELREKHIQSFDSLSDYDVIVNSAGLQARFLVPDPLVRPIRGQVMRVAAPWLFHGFEIDAADDHYVILNQECVVLGVTHEDDSYDTILREDDKKYVMDGCSRFFPALRNAPVVKHQAGLRPGREAVRLELENRQIGEKVVKIVHNYGHGGCGVTLSIGCAQEAAQLVKQALGFGGASKL